MSSQYELLLITDLSCFLSICFLYIKGTALQVVGQSKKILSINVEILEGIKTKSLTYLK